MRNPDSLNVMKAEIDEIERRLPELNAADQSRTHLDRDQILFELSRLIIRRSGLQRQIAAESKRLAQSRTGRTARKGNVLDVRR